MVIAPASRLTGKWAGQRRAAGLLVVIHAAAAAARCLCLLSVSLLPPLLLQPCLQRRRGRDNADPGVSCYRPPSLLLACASTPLQICRPLMVHGKGEGAPRGA
jgi:hypothetical protein